MCRERGRWRDNECASCTFIAKYNRSAIQDSGAMQAKQKGRQKTKGIRSLAAKSRSESRSSVAAEHDSPVWSLVPNTRSVNTEWERDERSFINVAATLRRDCATNSSEATCAGS